MKFPYMDTSMKVVITTILLFIVMPLALWFLGREFLEEIDQNPE